MLSTLRRALYIIARGIGDILSVSRGRAGTRAGRRAIGRTLEILLRNLF